MSVIDRESVAPCHCHPCRLDACQIRHLRFLGDWGALPNDYSLEDSQLSQDIASFPCGSVLKKATMTSHICMKGHLNLNVQCYSLVRYVFLADFSSPRRFH